MSGRRSHSKGARTERCIVNALQAYGLAAARVPLSGAVGGRLGGDIVLPPLGRELCVEVKRLSRRNAKNLLSSCGYRWLRKLASW